KWPDDPEAYRITKAAMGVQLAEALQSSYGLHTRASRDCIDVFADGFAFRLLLHSSRDEAMAARPEAPGHEEAERLAARLGHQGLVVGAAGQNAAWAPTARLAILWVNAHLAGNHICPEAVELLVAACFTTATSSLPVPGTSMAGFMRFLYLLGSHPWSIQALIVDPAGDLTREARQQLLADHEAAKQDGSAPALPIYSPADAASLWTRSRPTRAVVGRLAKLAIQSLQALQEVIEGRAGSMDDPAAWQSIFATPIQDFDQAILLNPVALPHSHRGLPVSPDLQPAHPQSLPQNAQAVLQHIPADVARRRGMQKLRNDLLIGLDPLGMFLSQLEKRLGGTVDFGADLVGGTIIGLRWKSRKPLVQKFRRILTSHYIDVAHAPQQQSSIAAAKMMYGHPLDDLP
ncbi:hypothetical protein WJX84_008605, partial [Apatococcus fuscideae]